MLVSVANVAKTIKRGVDPEMRNKNLSRKDEAILKTIYSIANKGKKQFCTPKLQTIQRILKKRYQINIAERTLRLHLRILEAKRYLIVRKMVGRTRNGTFIGRPNIYFITSKMRKFLKGMIKQMTIWISKDKTLLNKIYEGMNKETVKIFIEGVNRKFELMEEKAA